jgi:hypothetical protein
MQEQNRHLSLEQSRHLTFHGVSQNEDGTFSWKFDNYVRSIPPVDLSEDEIHELWGPYYLPHPAGLRYGKLGLQPGDGRSAKVLPQRTRRALRARGALDT